MSNVANLQQIFAMLDNTGSVVALNCIQFQLNLINILLYKLMTGRVGRERERETEKSLESK